MNLNEMLINLFKELGLEAQEDEYVGKKDKYVIFTYSDEKPVYFGDNKVLAETVYLQIRLVIPKEFNYVSLKKAIKETLRKKSFFVNSISSFLGDIYMETEKIRQIVFEVNYTKRN